MKLIGPNKLEVRFVAGNFYLRPIVEGGKPRDNCMKGQIFLIVGKFFLAGEAIVPVVSDNAMFLRRTPLGTPIS
jgi:hypothetical protein